MAGGLYMGSTTAAAFTCCTSGTRETDEPVLVTGHWTAARVALSPERFYKPVIRLWMVTPEGWLIPLCEPRPPHMRRARVAR
jgi:hypothetical protein